MLVKNWMSRPVVTVSTRASMQMARDLMEKYHVITSFSQQGIEVGIRIPDQPGATIGLVDAVRDAGGRLASLIATDSIKAPGIREVYLRIYRLKPEQQFGLMADLEQRGTLVYLVDHINAKRRIFNV